MADLRSVVRPGTTVAFSDGVGSPTAVLGELGRAAAEAGGVRLLLGWTVGEPTGLDPSHYARVSTIMSGFALRSLVDRGDVGYVPVRMGALPALIRDVLRPQLLVAAVVAGPDGFRFGTEVAWMRAAVEAGAVVAAVERPGLPACDPGPPLPAEQVVVVGSDPAPPLEVTVPEPGDVHRAIAERVAALIPAGAYLQFGPGQVGNAVCEALTAPVHVSSGLVGDAVVRLARRNVLLGAPTAAYLAGTAELYDWAPGRAVLHPFEDTHDPGWLAGLGGPFVAVNTALEVDLDGAVNVETAGGSTIGGIGGHADYAFAAARLAGGVSIVAVPSTNRGRPTLVEHLGGPVSTPGHDVDVLITEHGAADLRGLDRAARRAAIASLWR